MAHLRVESGRDVIQTVDLAGKSKVIVGRAVECDVPLDNPAVSRRHLVLRRTGPRWSVEDTSGGNGMIINGKPLRTADLADGDRIDVLKYTLVFSERDLTTMDELPALPKMRASMGPSNNSTKRLGDAELQRMRASMETRRQAHLLLADGRGEQRVVALSKTRVVLGKGEDVDVRLPPGLTVAAEHAEIAKAGNGWTLTPRGGFFAPTTVNGARAPQGTERPLKDGDVLEIGNNRIIFRDAA